YTTLFRSYYASRTKKDSHHEGSKNSLKQSLHELERSFGVSLDHKDEWAEGQKASRDISSFKSVEDELNELFKGTTLFYEKAGERFYVIYQRTNNVKQQASPRATVKSLPPLYASNSNVPEITVTKTEPFSPVNEFVVRGTVRDENNVTFPGVNIIIKGTTTGTSTDINGAYTLDVVSPDAVLVF